MSTQLVATEMGLQVHTGGIAAQREHRQPQNIRPAGRNAFEIAPDDAPASRAKPWRPAKLAAQLGVSSKTIKRRILDGALPALPLGGNRHAIPAHVALHVLRFGLNAYVRPQN